MQDPARRFKRWAARRLAAAYVAGPKLEDALRVRREAESRGWSTTIGFWNGPEHDPASVFSACRAALDAIESEEADCYLSIKPDAFGYDFGRLSALLQAARPCGVRIHFDAQHPDSAGRSFALLQRAAGEFSNLGFTLPSRWRRSLQDAERLIDLGIPIRVVRGQWPDPGAPDLDPRAGFLQLIEGLRGRAKLVGVATHDAALARESLNRLLDAGTPCELEQLLGWPLRGRSLGGASPVGARLYIAYGHAWLPYDFSRLRDRPAVLGWALKDLVHGVYKNPVARIERRDR